MAIDPDAGTRFVRVARVGCALAALALFLAASPLRAADDAPPPPRTWDNLPVAEKFLSPVGNPEDFSQPAAGEIQGYVLTRGLQERRRDRHLGLDLSNRSFGGEVRAPADGIVLEARPHSGWGQLVVIVHQLPGGDHVLSLLAHLKPGSIAVKPGDRVRAGQMVGAVGSSGHSTGPHLHLEFRDLGHADPWQTLWEQAPVLDPLRLLGKQLAGMFVPGLRNPAAGGGEDSRSLQHWGEQYLRAVQGDGRGGRTTLGNPEAALERREFYTWLARLSGSRLTARPAWSTVRRALARRGFTELPGAHAAATPIGRDEAAHALSHLLSTDFLPGVAAEERVAKSTLRTHALPVPAPALSTETGPTAGPDRPLTRAEGALLVMAARSWPGAAAERP
jgi:hypothetical protein